MTAVANNTIPAAPPTTAPAQAQPAATTQVPIPSAPGRTEIEAMPSADPSVSTAQVNKQKTKRCYTLEKQFVWRGEKYRVEIDFPTETILEPGSAEETQFKGEAARYAEIFIEDLKSRLDAENKILPGDDFSVFFNEAGYTAVNLDKNPGFDPTNMTEESLKGKEKVILARNETAKILSQAIGAETATKIRACLANKAIDPLRKSVAKEKAKAAINAAPVNLKQKNNSCFIDAPLQQLLNDPTLTEDLSNPDYYLGGTKNKLYRAVQKYREAQKSGERVNLASILREPGEPHLDRTGVQLDALTDAWNKFPDFLDFNKIPKESHLYSLFQARVMFHVGNGGKIEDLVKTDREFPDVISLQVQDRVQLTLPTGKLSDRLSFEEAGNFLVALQGIEETTEKERKSLQQKLGTLELHNFESDTELSSENYATCLDALHSDAKNRKILARYFVENTLNNQGANAVLDNEECLQAAFSLLKQEAKDPIHAKRIPGRVKNDHAAEIAPSGVVTLGTKKYDVISFTAHQGSSTDSGHHIAYYRKGDVCYKLDDLQQSPESITLQAFLKAAETASFYTLHKEGLSTDKGETSAKKAEEEALVATESEEIGSTKLDEVEGNLTRIGKSFTLVNPSNTNFVNPHPQLKDIVETRQLAEQISTEAVKEDVWYKPRKKFTPHNLLGAADMLTTNASGRTIFHIPLPEGMGQTEVDHAIKDILDYAMKSGKHEIAIPVFQIAGREEDEIVGMMRKAITNYINAQATTSKPWRGGHIRIVRSEKPKVVALPPPLATPLKPEPLEENATKELPVPESPPVSSIEPVADADAPTAPAEAPPPQQKSWWNRMWDRVPAIPVM